MIRVERGDDGLWLVTIDRADKANALTAALLEELADTAEAAQEARAFVLTGAGRVFSAGMDLEAAQSGLATSPVWERLSSAIAALPGLSIAALNGTLAGGAMGMALACDLRLAVPGAKFFYPVMKLGFLPQPSDPGRLAQLVGPARAKLILMGGQRITVEEALAFGLVDRIVAPEELIATARAIAGDTLAADPDFASTIKGMCRPS
ncbi:enoyl-CoA hydratase/isomerase family protein [Pseudooceanicola sp. 216_PA32_1]|uniref:Enoyl-CoA hydratase/isomerase family protein n=1 Tax=Pseudooceanicola pacificus TaxID=2676438 RepID=A0A844W0C9_9RHOB|nr:enoyl-CoA hydratase/isomerase family protein [Pseudooceanicola pacificus]MWB76565.1 enoyl-CoA hydratase/isomerase family protein [Pseudooceanicola pacificus]